MYDQNVDTYINNSAHLEIDVEGVNGVSITSIHDINVESMVIDIRG